MSIILQYKEKLRIINIDFDSFILGNTGMTWATWMFNTFFIYLINFVILGGCLVKLLVYGDSVPKSQSKEAGLFYQHKKQADEYLKKVSIDYF